MVEGKVQREGEIIHVIVRRCYNYSGLLRQLTESKASLSKSPMSRSDETTSPFLSNAQPKKPEIIQGKIFPDGRNFR